MTIFWILALIVTNITTATICLRKKKPATAKIDLNKFEDDGWKEGFDHGWRVALSDGGAVWEAYKKIFRENTQDH